MIDIDREMFGMMLKLKQDDPVPPALEAVYDRARRLMDVQGNGGVALSPDMRVWLIMAAEQKDWGLETPPRFSVPNLAESEDVADLATPPDDDEAPVVPQVPRSLEEWSRVPAGTPLLVAKNSGGEPASAAFVRAEELDGVASVTVIDEESVEYTVSADRVAIND